ncbi:MAG TPA: DNA methyltransferase [Candidatus Paceibacterota bacterium]|jgi:hypothetical protein|nr:DNA methyltransferase [Candidatus Paceibacterota bacterium]
MSKDLKDLTKVELIEYIDELIKLLNNGKYGLYFDRSINKDSLINTVPILKRKSKLDIHSDNKLENIFIEGDNLLVLSALKTITDEDGLVHVITIDPPYNTGNDGFTFRDGFQHSEWLSFMEKRLALARDILKENGVIFINIDHNEHYNLKLLCDRIFGPSNFISDFVWINNTKGRQISNGGAVKTYENILLYAKNAELINTFQGDIRELSKEMPLMYKNKDYKVYEDEKGKYIIKNELYNTNSSFNEETRPNLVFNIYYNEDKQEVVFSDVDDIEFQNNLDSDFILIEPHKNSNGQHNYHAWRWSKDKIRNELNDLHFEKYQETYKVFTKVRDMYATNLKDVISDSTNGNKEVADIIGKDKFSFPKPVKLIKRLIKSYENTFYEEESDTFVEKEEPVVILDFFAGSGTTAQAVLELNQEDSKNRMFILNTLNEVSDTVLTKYLRSVNKLSKNSTKKMLKQYKESTEYNDFILTEEYKSLGIARAVAHERLKRIRNGKALKGFYSKNNIDFTMRYFIVDTLKENISRDQTKYDLVERCDGLLNIKEQVYEKVGTGTNFNLYSNKENKCMGIYNNYFETTSFNEMLLKIKNLNMANNIIYYFSLDNNIDENIEKKVRDIIPNSIVKPIPSKIYEIYKDISDNIRRMY